jgi:hypothetical protein
MKNNYKTSNKCVPFRLKPVNNLWAVPAGIYCARVSSVTSSPSKKDATKETIKIVFDVFEDRHGNSIKKLAKIDYTEGTEEYEQLQTDLEAFCNPEDLQEMREKSVEMDLKDLVGTEVDIVVSTYQNKGHQHPYSKIVQVAKRGRLIQDNPRYMDLEDVSLAI